MSRLVRHSSTPRRVAFAYRHSRGEPILMVTKAKNCFDPRAILNGHVPRICKETSLISHNPSSVPGRDLWQRLCSILGGRSDMSQHSTAKRILSLAHDFTLAISRGGSVQTSTARDTI